MFHFVSYHNNNKNKNGGENTTFLVMEMFLYLLEKLVLVYVAVSNISAAQCLSPISAQ